MNEVKTLKAAKYLIIEDNVGNRDNLLRALLYKAEVPSIHIQDVGHSDKAKELILDFEPDIVLLDLKIPRIIGEEPNISNAVDVLNTIELFNVRNQAFIKVIVISGSVEDSGVQKLILGDRSNIIRFLDKGDNAIDTDGFKTTLIEYIEKALKKEEPERKVEYNVFRNSQIKKLKTLHPSVWEKIESNIIIEFEKLFNKDANIPPRAKQIIGSSGEVVEDIIALLADYSLDLSAQKYSDDPNSVRRKLQGLTGRRWIGREDGFENTGSDVLITRAAAEYGAEAYLHRSHALHGNEGDDKNERLYPQNYKFTIEDAAISINLIMPLINDYIKHLESKQKKK